LCQKGIKTFELDVVLTVHRRWYVEIKCQLDATDVSNCRSYCLLNMFRAPLCPSSGAREYYTVGCRLWSLVLGFQVVGMVWSWGLCVRFAGCCSTQPSTPHHTGNLKTKHQIPQAATTCIILSSSWRWAQWCPKHVEQAVRSAVRNICCI
jgi:hypothetical protein